MRCSMSNIEKSELEDETKKKIEKLRETLSETLGVSSSKLFELEKELQTFQSELANSSNLSITEKMNDSEQILRLYATERSLTEVLHQKIQQLEMENLELKTDLKTQHTTIDLITNF